MISRRGHARRAREIGIEAYLVKPIRQSELYNCLANISKIIDVEPAQKTELPSIRSEKLLTRHSLNESANYEKSNHRILVAEDNIVNQKVVTRQIEKLGFAADIVNNGQKAVKALTTGNYSLVLMDCQMPVMDGFAATAEIRRLENSGASQIPIIALTAHAIEGDREKCLAAGMNDYLSKPTTLAALGEMLNRWLKNPAPAKIDDKATPFAAADIEAEKLNISTRLSLLRSECGTETVAEFIDLFLDDGAERLARLNSLISKPESPELRREIHGLNGSAANMGAKQISELCRRMETEIAADNFAAVENLYTKVSVFFKLLKPHYLAERSCANAAA